MNDDISMEDIKLQTDDSGLTLDDFGPGNFVKNPPVGETLTLTILKVSNNLNTKGINKETGKEFIIGLKSTKNDKVRRIDIDTDQGVYTIGNWEIFFKFFGKEGLLVKYAKANNKMFTGAKIRIKRLIDGAHSSYKISDLAKILGKPELDAARYQEEVKAAIKEQRLFEVTLLN